MEHFLNQSFRVPPPLPPPPLNTSTGIETKLNQQLEQALQFGRIDRCTYTLDYKYPFNAVQAMAIALASLTQRLK